MDALDELDEDEDEQINYKDILFVAEKDFLLKYGNEYKILFTDGKINIVPTSQG